MGKIKVFEIRFGNERNVFHSGNPVTGSLHLQAVGNVQVQSITLTMVGKGKVKWTGTIQGSRGRTYRQKYHSQQIFVNTTTTMLSPESGHSKITLPEGEYCYNFEFQLPVTCPTSFEGAYGYIRYWCKATVARPWKFDVETKNACTVLSGYDLKSERLLANPVPWDLHHKVFCCCCMLGQIDIALQLNKTGFVPGESIRITGEVSNNTKVSIATPHIMLHQTVEYGGYADGETDPSLYDTKTTTCVVKRQPLTGSSLRAGQTQVWNEAFVVPSLPPSGLRGANYINIKYAIQVAMKPRFDDLIQWRKDITIGTVPILNTPLAGSGTVTRSAQSDSPLLPTLPFAHAHSGLDPSAPPIESYRMEDLPPPSYEDCISGKVHIRDEEEDTAHVRGALEFAPRYTYYNLNRQDQNAAAARI